MKSGKRTALGRGLGTLIPTSPAPSPSSSPTTGLQTVAIDQLRANPTQPRTFFDEIALQELAASLQQHGMLQPIVVAPSPKDTIPYTIVAGERRWRAARLAGFSEVSVLIRQTPESDWLELALIENIQRQELNPIDEALAFRQLMDVGGHTQEQLAKRVGKDRSTISNALRLLKLPIHVQDLVKDGSLSMGHARALLACESSADMVHMANKIIAKQLSVRATEQAIRNLRKPKTSEPSPPSATPSKREIIVRELQDRLRQSLGAKVRLKTKSKHKGVIELPYQSLDELDRFLNILLPPS